MKIELSLVLLLAVCAFGQSCGPPGRVCRNSGECCLKYCQHFGVCGREPDENPCSLVDCRYDCWIVDVKQADGTWKPTARCI